MDHKPIKCIAIDDEPLSLALIRDYVGKRDDFEFLGGFTNTLRAKELLQDGEIELVFCDIRMPGESGLELASCLPPGCAVVFITAYEQYALEGFRVDAIDYLLKPVSPEEFDKCCVKIKRYLRPAATNTGHAGNTTVTIHSKRKDMIVNTDDILYVQAMKDYMMLMTRNGKIITHCTMKQLAAMLPSPPFVQVHRSFIVNKKHVSAYSNDFVQIGDKTIPVAAKRQPG